jgi:hypothetical protein
MDPVFITFGGSCPANAHPDAQPSLGLFVKHRKGTVINGRPSYIHATQSNVMLWWMPNGDWCVGKRQDYGTSRCLAKCRTGRGVALPHQITAKWKVLDNRANWIDEVDIRVSTLRPSFPPEMPNAPPKPPTPAPIVAPPSPLGLQSAQQPAAFAAEAEPPASAEARANNARPREPPPAKSDWEVPIRQQSDWEARPREQQPPAPSDWEARIERARAAGGTLSAEARYLCRDDVSFKDISSLNN